MKKRLWPFVAAALIYAAPAQARMFGEFTVGNWSGAAYTDEKGEFNHCGAFLFTRDRTMVGFSVGRNFTWSMGFYNRDWKLPTGEPLPVMFGVDEMKPLQLDARVIARNNVEIGLGDSGDLFRRFRAGRRLKVLGMPKPIDFNLSGVDRVLPTLLACAWTKGTKKIPNLARDPAADIPNYTTRQLRSDTAMVAEATTLAANLLSATGATGYRLLGPKEEPSLKGDARWIVPGEGIGLIQVHPDMTRDVQLSLGRMLIADDARDCKGSFMSGALPDDEQTGSARVFTTCDTGKATLISYYFTMQRPAGGAYLIATISSEASEPTPRAREADARFRKAAYAISGR